MRDASRRGFTDSVRPARLLGQSEPYLFFFVYPESAGGVSASVCFFLSKVNTLHSSESSAKPAAL